MKTQNETQMGKVLFKARNTVIINLQEEGII